MVKIRILGNDIESKKTLPKKIKVNSEVVKDIAKKAGIKNRQAYDIILYGTKKYLIDKNGNMKHIDIAEKNPLLLKEFGIHRLEKNTAVKRTHTFKKSGTRIIDDLEKTKVSVHISLTLYNKYWDNNHDNGIRHQSFTLNNVKNDEIPEEIIKRVSDNFGELNTENLYEQIIDITSNNNGKKQLSLEAKEQITDNSINIINIEFMNLLQTEKFEYDGMQLRKEKPLDLQYIYENVELNNNKDCAKVYLKDKCKFLQNEIDKLGDKNGVSIKEIVEFSKNNNISLSVYDLQARLRERVKGKKIFLNFIAYDNHLYPINSTLKRKVYDKEPSIKSDINCNKKLFDLLEQGIIPQPKDIQLDNEFKNGKIKILSFSHNNIIYIDNTDFKQCKDILSIYGLQNEAKPSTNFSNIHKIINPIYGIKNNLDSIIFNPKDFKRTAFNYNNGITAQYTIDRNCAYASDLMSLPFLIVFDGLTTECTKIENEIEIIDHYLYLIKVDKSSLLLPVSGLYSGYFVKFCLQEGLRFDIIEQWTTRREDNYYFKYYIDLHKNLIDKYGDKQGYDYFKDIYKREIGCFERLVSIDKKFETTGIYNVEEKNDHPDEDIYELNENYFLTRKKELCIMNLTNKIPINSQVKDECRKQVYLKAKQLGLVDKDIIQIKTDSLSYNGKKIYPSKEIGGWKYEKFRPLEKKDINDTEINTIFPIKSSNNILYNCYAGAGKTYHIKNKLVPKLEDFVILTPTNKALEIYRNDEDLKDYAKVCAYYTMRNEIPKEQNIIVDEIGMCDREMHYLLIKCKLLNKNIYAYGDFNQLLNPDEQKMYNSEYYLNFMFNKRMKLNTNYRNDFSIEYYDKLINNEIDIIDEIKKYSTKKPSDAEMIICYKNDTVNKYNKLYMEHNKIKLLSVGTKIICRENIITLQKRDIYKGIIYTIKEIDGNNIILNNNSIISKSQLKNERYFKPAYALTIYCMQGSETKSFYYPEEDYSFITPRLAYTLISRIKK